MKIKPIYISIIFCFINGIVLNAQEFTLEKDIRYYLYAYVESHGQRLDNNCISEDNLSCIIISDMLKNTKIFDNDNLEYSGIYSFERLYTNPSHRFLFMKCGPVCKIIREFYYDDELIEYSEHLVSGEYLSKNFDFLLLSAKINQVLDFFAGHNDMDISLLQQYLAIVCNVHQENLRYLE